MGITKQDRIDGMAKALAAPKADVKRYCKGRAAKVRGILAEHYDGEDLAASAADLLADLMHMVEASATILWEDCEDRARAHFNAELMGGEHG